MIKSIKIEGFKRFARCQLPFRRLSLLTGLNGSGKTSVLQALLLAREAGLADSHSVALNGPFGLELGSVLDVLNVRGAGDDLTIRVEALLADGTVARFAFDASDETLLQLPVCERKPERAPEPFGGNQRVLTYLGAERLGPRDALGSSSRPVDELGVGVRGEFCAQILDLRGLVAVVPTGRRHPNRLDEPNAFLKYQVEAWLSDIARPIEIDALSFPNTSVTSLRFRSPGGNWVRAPNMGFGLSYSLPIVLAGLFAPPGAVLVVENPEAHLHPEGQSRMGGFLAAMAADGLQVIVETHSDHVLNGIRRAIAELGALAPADAIVHFFDDTSDGEPEVHTLAFTEGGGVDKWPRRFFDQYQVDVAALARVRRQRRT